MTLNVVSPTPVQNPSGTKYAKDEPLQNPAFKAKVQEQKSDEFVVKKVPATTGRKWGVGLASYFCPGLGQAINGQWGKAAGFFCGTLGLSTIIGTSMASAILKGGKSMKLAGGALAAGMGMIALNIWNVVDAVKNAKSEVLVPKK